MKQGSSGSLLSTVFVDYDNIYLSLKRKSEEAAKKFAKNSSSWLSAIESGALITTTNGQPLKTKRRLVMSRCYGNPVPRRNSHDNATDMNSFPFVRHHFLRSGFEIIDCPPLTAQLKNSADIRMVMDIRDLLTHETYFDEFIVLSGDADFTPLLHRLRAHARRTVIFANDYTAAPYTAICDGEIRESDLIRLLVEGKLPGEVETPEEAAANEPTAADLAELRREIIAEVTNTARTAGQPIPLESLADRAVRTLGHEKTVGSAWGGAGSFRELLASSLTGDIRLSDQPPYFVYDASRYTGPKETSQVATTSVPAPELQASVPSEPVLQPLPEAVAQAPEPEHQPQQHHPARKEHAAPAPAAPGFQHTGMPTPPAQPYQAPTFEQAMPPPAAEPQQAAPAYALPALTQPLQSFTPATEPQLQQREQAAAATFTPQAQPQSQAPAQSFASQPATQQQASAPQQQSTQAVDHQAPSGPTEIQKSIARIHEACQAPPLSPPEYRTLFQAIAQEITARGWSGAKTLDNISQRLRDVNIEARIDDVRFVIEVVSESDPWLEQGASANLFSSRFRNFVVARCRTQGLALSADEIDLIDAWFLAPVQDNVTSDETAPQQTPQAPQQGYAQHNPQQSPAPANQHQPQQAPQEQQAPAPDEGQAGGDRWWNRQHAHGQQAGAEDPYTDRFADNRADQEADEFPRIIRDRLRG